MVSADPLRRMWIIGCVALSVLLRADDLTSDPPTDLEDSGGYFADEGFWTHNARNKVLFGQWRLDDWNNMYASPLSHWPQYAVFRVAGVGLAQARVLPVMLSAVSCALASALPGEAGMAAALLFAVDPLMVHFGRIALLETPVMALLMMAWALLAGSLGPGRLALAGFAAGLGVATKPSAWFFIPAALAAVAAVPPSGGRVRATAWFCLGCAAAAVAWVLMVGSGMGLFLQYGRYYASQQAPWWGSLWANLTTPVLFSRFRYSLPETVWGSVVAVSAVGPALWGRVARPVALACLWALLGAACLSTLTYDPLRYYMVLLPALLILAAWGITEAWHGRLRISLLWAAVALSFPFVWPEARAQVRHLAPSVRYWSMWRHGIACAAVAAGLAGAWWVFRRALRNGTASRMISVVIIAACLANGCARHAYWLRTRRHAVVSASRLLGSNFAPTVFTGQWAPELCVETQHRAVPVWPGFVNGEGDPFTAYGITHGVIWDRHWERFRSWFPQHFSCAEIIDTLWIKNSPVILCRFPEAERSPPGPAPDALLNPEPRPPEAP